MKKSIQWVLDDELAELIRGVPAIALEGPKGVGKTATAARLATTVRRLGGEPAERPGKGPLLGNLATTSSTWPWSPRAPAYRRPDGVAVIPLALLAP